MRAGVRRFRVHEVPIIEAYLGIKAPVMASSATQLPPHPTVEAIGRIATLAELALSGSAEFRDAALREILTLARGAEG